MKKITNSKKILWFLFIFTVFFYFLNSFLVPTWNYPKFYENRAMANKEFRDADDCDVVLLGSSHMMDGVSPMKIYEDTGFVTYNMASSNQHLELSKYIIEETINAHTPKIIIMDVSTLYSEPVDRSWYHVILDSFPMNHNKYQLASYYLNHRGGVKDGELLGLLFPFYEFHNNWMTLSTSDFWSNGNKNYFMQGFYTEPVINKAYDYDIDIINHIDNMAVDIQNEAPIYVSNTSGFINDSKNGIIREVYYTADISDSQKMLLREINELCKENDCELLLVKIPVFIDAGEYQSSWSQSRSRATHELADELSLKFVDLLYDEDVGIDWKHDSFDKGKHLNLLGADKVTAFLEAYLLNNYELKPVHSDNYDKKLVLYNKYVDVAGIELSYIFTDYLQKIKDSGHDLEVFISVKDDMSTSLTEEDIRALSSLGFSTDFTAIKYNDSFLAVWDNGIIEYEGVSNREQQYSTNIGYDEISISSAGYLVGNKSSIKINGREYSMNQRGINIVVYDKESGLIVDRAVCDTWAPDHEVVHNVGNLLFEYQEYLLGRK